jgi:hypothetical protein
VYSAARAEDRPSTAAAERQAGDPGGRDGAAGNREAELLRFAVDVAPECAPLDARAPGATVHVDTAHEREVDHEPGVYRRPPAHVVAAAPDGNLEAVFTAELHSTGDVGGPEAARYEGRPLVDQAVVNPARPVPLRVARLQKATVERLCKLSCRRCEIRHAPPFVNSVQPVDDT